MNKQDKQEPNNQQSLIEDLAVNEEQAVEVKGGPIYMKIDGVDGDVTATGASSHGTGAGAGKVSMNDFHFVMK